MPVWASALCYHVAMVLSRQARTQLALRAARLRAADGARARATLRALQVRSLRPFATPS